MVYFILQYIKFKFYNIGTKLALALIKAQRESEERPRSNPTSTKKINNGFFNFLYYFFIYFNVYYNIYYNIIWFILFYITLNKYFDRRLTVPLFLVAGTTSAGRELILQLRSRSRCACNPLHSPSGREEKELLLRALY